ncbi:MAG TPA: arsenate reductase (glutaredoxin) [Longimicrobiales bacterium]
MAGARVIIYQKPTCTTCRTVMRLLREGGIDYEAVDYTLDPIPREKLVELLRKMGATPRALLRTRERAFTDLGLDRPEVTDDEILDAMVAHPELVQRPIIERGDRAVLARPPERVWELLQPGASTATQP